MYTVIVCPDCEQPKVVEDVPERTKCGRCQTSLKFRELKHYYETDDSAEAKKARGAIAAQLRGKGDRFEELLDSDILDSEAVSERIDDEYQSAHGLDDAGDDDQSDTAGSSRSRQDIVRDGIDECDPASEEAVLDYAVDHGVPRGKAERILRKLRERGEVLRSNGAFRLV